MERALGKNNFLYYSFKIFRRFLLAPILRPILHNQLALTIFGKWTKTNGLHGYIQRGNSYFLTKSERKKYKNTLNISFDRIYVLFEEYLQGETSALKPCREIGQRFEKSLRGGSLVQNLETVWMINKTVIEIGFRRMWRIINADLGECYPPRPSASVDNILLDLHNSSHPTQPHSIIAN